MMFQSAVATEDKVARRAAAESSLTILLEDRGCFGSAGMGAMGEDRTQVDELNLGGST